VKRIGTREIIVRIYDNVHAALWAGLLAFVAYFIVIVAPKMPEAAATAQRQRDFEISAEHNFYCEKWKMGPGTQAHDQCLLDLQAFRASVERRFADETYY
jgi:hypothetical protein